MKTITMLVVSFVTTGGITIPSCFGEELNPREIVARSISNYEKDWSAALEFTYTERDVSKDPSGRPATSEISQVFDLNGTPYTRLVGKNGHPLNSEENGREEEKYRKAQTARDTETPEQRAQRLRKYREQRSFLFEVPNAFEMKMLGHETINGRGNYVIELSPKPGYVPTSKNARLFSVIAGKLWIDETDLRWSRAEARVIDTISIGWFLARIGPGAHITLTQVKVDVEHWLLKEIDIKGTARIMLVKNRTLDETVSCSDYRRVRSAVGPAAARNQ